MSEFVESYFKSTDRLLIALADLEELESSVNQVDELSPAEAIALDSLRIAVSQRVRARFKTDTTEEIADIKLAEGQPPLPALNGALDPNQAVAERPGHSFINYSKSLNGDSSQRPLNPEENSMSLFARLCERIIPISPEIPTGSSPNISVIGDSIIQIHGKEKLVYNLRPREVIALNMILDSREGVSYQDMVIRLGLDSRTPPERRESLKTGLATIRTILSKLLEKDGQTSGTIYRLPSKVIIADTRDPQGPESVKKK